MLRLCEQGKVTELIVTRIDRLARSVVTFHKAIAIFQRNNIKLNVLDAPLPEDDLDNPFSFFSMSQMSALADFESRLLQQRVKRGMEYFRAENKAPQNAPFGYVRRNDKYEPNLSLHTSGKTYWALANEIIEYYLSNRTSLRNTCHHFLKTYQIKFSSVGLRSWLTNPALRGHTRYNVKHNRRNPAAWDIRYNTHQPLITESTYKQIEALFKENQRRWGANFNRNPRTELLTGQIICGCCGAKCYVHNRKTSMALRCKGRRVYGEGHCTNKKGIKLPQVVASVDAALTQKAIELKNYTIANQPTKLESKELTELKLNLTTLENMPGNPIIDNAIRETKLQIQVLQQHDENNARLGAELGEELIRSFGDPDFYSDMSEHTKHSLYRKFVKTVVIRDGAIISIDLVDVL